MMKGREQTMELGDDDGSGVWGQAGMEDSTICWQHNSTCHKMM